MNRFCYRQRLCKGQKTCGGVMPKKRQYRLRYTDSNRSFFDQRRWGCWFPLRKAMEQGDLHFVGGDQP